MQSLSELWVDLLSSKYTVGPNFLLSINPFGGSSTWSSIIFEQKTSSMTIFRGVQVWDLLHFCSPLGPLLAALDHSFPMSIYMIYSSRQKSCFRQEIDTPRVSTLNSLSWFMILLSTLTSSSMILSKTPSFRPTTKMTLTRLKVPITGYSPRGIHY
jgi:hypothetical protein